MPTDNDKENLNQDVSPVDNDIGYGKPPEHSRFRPGRSGNPKGRPKGRRSFKTILAAAMHETVTIRTAKGPRKITKLEALVQKTINDALTGDVKSTRIMLAMLDKAGLDSEVSDAVDAVSARDLSEEDSRILARYLGPQESENVNPGDDTAGADE